MGMQSPVDCEIDSPEIRETQSPQKLQRVAAPAARTTIGTCDPSLQIFGSPCDPNSSPLRNAAAGIPFDRVDALAELAPVFQYDYHVSARLQLLSVLAQGGNRVADIKSFVIKGTRRRLEPPALDLITGQVDR